LSWIQTFTIGPADLGVPIAATVTIADGQPVCTVSKRYRKAKASVTFRVTSVTYPGAMYASGANHDPDGDSDGTSIVVARP
jgi:hypothetical protein